MKNRLNKCLLACLLFPLTACAHYYQGQSGYYPNGGGYGSSYGGWQRNYYGNMPGRNYNYYNGPNGNYQNYRQPQYPVVPRWDHEGHGPDHHNEGWNNRYGYNQGDHDGGDRNSWRQHDGVRDNSNRGEHQDWGNNRPGQYNNHRRDHDE